MARDPFVGCNFQTPPELCTLETCCLAQSNFQYLPSYGGNLFFAIFFGALLVPQFALGVFYRTTGFAIGNVLGLVLEVIGYASRVWLHDSPFNHTPFLM